jgi:adenosylhomocysteine nucleosidase
MMRVLVTFAVEAEFAPWRRLRNLESLTLSGIPIFRARLGSAEVDFAMTGMGSPGAFRLAHALLAEPYQACITCGFAGSLKENHAVGEVLVAGAVQELGKSRTLECASNLVQAAETGGGTRVGLFLTSDHVVRTAEEKRRLAQFADAVEMESFAVLSAAAERGRSAVAIRVVSDSVRQDMPAVVEAALDETGRVKLSSVARYLARHPLQLAALLRLGRDSKNAAEALSRFLEAYIRNLSFPAHEAVRPGFEESAVR